MKYITILICIPVLATAGCSSKKPDTKPQQTTVRETPMSKIKTTTGLEYEIIKEGTGAIPTKGKPVTVHYTGWLDVAGNPGTKFDSSHDRKQPFTFVIGMGQVIRGWDEGVMGMKVGEVRRLYIPANLGYGAYGAGRIIPANANLIFDVELLNV